MDLDEMQEQYIEEEGYTFVEMWKCEHWKLYETDKSIKKHLREKHPFKRPLRQDHLIDGIKSSALFDYIQCDIKDLEHLKKKSRHFFKITNVCREDIGPLMQE